MFWKKSMKRENIGNKFMFKMTETQYVGFYFF